MPKSPFQKCYEDWNKGWRKCIIPERGGYFEGDQKKIFKNGYFLLTPRSLSYLSQFGVREIAPIYTPTNSNSVDLKNSVIILPLSAIQIGNICDFGLPILRCGLTIY